MDVDAIISGNIWIYSLFARYWRPTNINVLFFNSYKFNHWAFFDMNNLYNKFCVFFVASMATCIISFMLYMLCIDKEIQLFVAVMAFTYITAKLTYDGIKIISDFWNKKFDE